MREYILKVGEQADLRKNWFRHSWALIYAGMPSETSFSIALKYEFGHQAMAYSLFFPVVQKEFRFKSWRMTLLEVKPDRIRIGVAGP